MIPCFWFDRLTVPVMLCWIIISLHFLLASQACEVVRGFVFGYDLSLFVVSLYSLLAHVFCNFRQVSCLSFYQYIFLICYLLRLIYEIKVGYKLFSVFFTPSKSIINVNISLSQRFELGSFYNLIFLTHNSN
jgi:hypothetical protein